MEGEDVENRKLRKICEMFYLIISELKRNKMCLNHKILENSWKI